MGMVRTIIHNNHMPPMYQFSYFLRRSFRRHCLILWNILHQKCSALLFQHCHVAIRDNAGNSWLLIWNWRLETGRWKLIILHSGDIWTVVLACWTRWRPAGTGESNSRNAHVSHDIQFWKQDRLTASRMTVISPHCVNTREQSHLAMPHHSQVKARQAPPVHHIFPQNWHQCIHGLMLHQMNLSVIHSK